MEIENKSINEQKAKKTIRGIFVGETAKEVTIEASLDAYYKLLNCDCIDIVMRRIGGKNYAIICDDEGTFKEKPRLSAVYQDRSPALVGEIFITEQDECDLMSLNDDDVKNIMEHIMVGFDTLGRKVVVVVLDK